MEPSEEKRFVNWRWGYVIILSKFMLMFLDAGIAKSFGVLIPEMVIRFDANYATIGFICSLPSTLTYFACPFVSLILERTNHRLVALAGAMMSGACLVSCAFFSNTAVLGVLLALTGVGLACIYMPMTLLVNSYFPEDFVLMNTFSLFGLTAGATFLPFIIERSREAYGYSGSFLILGGISCNVIVCAAAIRKPILKKRSQRHPQGQIDGLDRTDEESAKVGSNESKCNENNQMTASETSTMSRKHGTGGHGSCRRKTAARTDDDGLGYAPQASTPPEEGRPGVLLEELDVKNTESLQLINIDTVTEQDEVSSTSIGKQMKPTGSVPWYKSCCAALTFHDRLFLFNVPTYFLSSYVLYAWMLFLVPHAEQLGISESRAVFLSSIAGIGGIIGRTVFIILVTKNVNVYFIYTTAGIICTMSLMLDFVGAGYPVRAGLAFIQGLCFFTEDAVSFAIIKSTVLDQNDFNRASAMMLFLSGLGVTAAGYGTGFLFDITQSYTKVFTVIDIIHAVIVVNVIITLVLLRNRTSVVNINNQ